MTIFMDRTLLSGFSDDNICAKGAPCAFRKEENDRATCGRGRISRGDGVRQSRLSTMSSLPFFTAMKAQFPVISLETAN